jgi:uncharacterized protein (TIGR03118 family)
LIHLVASHRKPTFRAGLLAAAAGLLLSHAALAQTYTATILTDNVCCEAPHFDPFLASSWGIAFAPGSFAWVVGNSSSAASQLDGSGNPQPPAIHMDVPFLFTPSQPSSVGFNITGEFPVPDGAGGKRPAFALFSTQEGTITAWSPTTQGPQNTHASIVIDSSRSGAANEACYTGMVITPTASGTRLYAADFRNRRIDAFDGDYNPVAAPFTDPNLPAGYAPYNIMAAGGRILIVYAIPQSNGFDVVTGPALGIVDAFSLEGQFQQRLITGGPLNAPWGIAIAPANFGPLSNALLVANVGDGLINAFNATTGAPLGPLPGPTGPLTIDGIRGIQFGNGALNQPTNALYFVDAPSFAAFGEYGRIELTNSCYANCDGSTAAPVLNANDFQCFLNRFASGDPAANCDGSTIAPILNSNDFQCFLNKFAAGCT